MKASKASKIADDYIDPQDIKGIVKHIEDMAVLGFTNTNIHLYVSEDRVKQIHTKLIKLGYNVYVEANEDRVSLHLTW